MKTKMFFFVIILFSISQTITAQVKNKKFQKEFDGMGLITLEFKTDKYELANSDGTVLVEGNYTIAEKTITFNDIKGEIACPLDVLGKYELAVENKELKLKLVEDVCQGRSVIGNGCLGAS